MRSLRVIGFSTNGWNVTRKTPVSVKKNRRKDFHIKLLWTREGISRGILAALDASLSDSAMNIRLEESYISSSAV